jgi:hypothetical protein
MVKVRQQLQDFWQSVGLGQQGDLLVGEQAEQAAFELLDLICSPACS